MDLSWPTDSAALAQLQDGLAAAQPPPWRPPSGQIPVGGVFVCFPRGKVGVGNTGDAAWVGAAVTRGNEVIATATVTGEAGAPYQPGLLAMREGPLIEAAVKALDVAPDVLLVNATGRDHPRRAGLALHLGAVLDTPSIGVTNRPLLAEGQWPHECQGATSSLLLDGEVIGYWLRTRPGTRPLVVHPGWRTDVDTAVRIVLTVTANARTPLPLRAARRLARESRAQRSTSV